MTLDTSSLTAGDTPSSTARIPKSFMEDPTLREYILQLDQIMDPKSPDILFLRNSIEQRINQLMENFIRQPSI